MRFQTRFTACPKCRKPVRRGMRRFGPIQAQCGHCQTTLKTGLTPWADFPIGQKITLALGEIVNPSWVNIPGCQGLILVPFLHASNFIMTILPVMLIKTSINPVWSEESLRYIPLSLLIYPFLLSLRLIWMIRESNAYSKNQTIPVWK